MSRITRTRIAVAATAALAISFGGPAASAYWQTLGSNDGGARADTILALGAPTATASAGGAAVNWTQGSTAGGRAVSGYTVARYSSAIPNAMVAAGGGCAGTISAPLTTLSCTEAALPSGTWYYTVTPVLGSWAGPESVRSGGVVIADTTKPNPPVIGAAGVVNIGNKFTAPVSGTAAVGVSSVKVTATDAQGLTKESQPALTDSSGKWAVSNFDVSGLGDGVITYTAVAKNAAGSSSDPSSAVTTTKDTVAPTATVTLVNNGTAGIAEKGDEIRIQFSKPMSLPSICSTWMEGQQPPEISAKDDVVVSITGTNLSVSRTLPGCALNIGTVSLGASYAISGTLTFEGSGSNVSKIAWNQNSQTLTITLGQRTGSAKTGLGESVPTVVPPTGVKDLAGNQALSAAPATASRF
jgi:hypothetical protein